MSTFTVINPATAEPIREVARASVGEVDAAIARAVKAQRHWASLAPLARADALRAFARVVESHVEELALLEVRNSGHPISSARWEASHVAQVLNYYAGSPERLVGQQIPVAGGIDVTFHEPYGVVGIIVPWNFPMTIARGGSPRRSPPGTPWCSSPPNSLRSLRCAWANSLSRRVCPRGSSKSSRARARSSGSGSSRIRTCARWSSPVRPRSARTSQPAAPARSSR